MEKAQLERIDVDAAKNYATDDLNEIKSENAVYEHYMDYDEDLLLPDDYYDGYSGAIAEL